MTVGRMREITMVRPRFRLLSFVFLVMQGSRAQDKAVSLLLLLRLTHLREAPGSAHPEDQSEHNPSHVIQAFLIHLLIDLMNCSKYVILSFSFF